MARFLQGVTASLCKRSSLKGERQYEFTQKYFRENITKIREEIIKLGFSSDAQSMRDFRKFAQESNNSIFESIKHSQDFCSMSGLRDLVFHEQEHHFTIPQIQNILNELKLSFCGFTGEKVLSAFRSRFPQNDAVYDLQKWSDFENENPNTFDQMYQFWCQKISQVI